MSRVSNRSAVLLIATLLMMGLPSSPASAAIWDISGLVCEHEDARVDLNSASAREIRSVLPGVGRAISERMVADRPLLPSVETIEDYSRANRRAIDRAVDRGAFCFSTGPFDHPDGGTINIALPDAETLVTYGDLWLRVPAGVVDEPCFASVSVPPVAPAPQDTAFNISPGDGADFNLDCEWSGTVELSWLTGLQLGDEGTYLTTLYSYDTETWSVEEVSEAFSDGRVIVEVDHLSWGYFTFLTFFTRPDPTGALLDLGLNDVETEYCRYRVWTCVRLAPTSREAPARLAQDGYSLYGNAAHGNALGHCTWVAFMAVEAGYDFAIGFATAHEDGSANPFSLDSTMDRHNNLIGASHGSAASSREDAYQLCKGSLNGGELRYLVNIGNYTVLCPTNETCLPTPEPTPEPPPPGGGGGLTFTFTENPFVCDGTTRSLGTAHGASPGEQITFFSPQIGALLPGTADGQGNLGLIWTCTPDDRGLTWTVNATGSVSGKTGTFTVTGA